MRNAFITDHAMVRYLQRIMRIPLEEMVTEAREYYGHKSDDHVILDMAEAKYGLTRQELHDEIATPNVRRFLELFGSGVLRDKGIAYTCKNGLVVTLGRNRELSYHYGRNQSGLPDDEARMKHRRRPNGHHRLRIQNQRHQHRQIRKALK